MSRISRQVLIGALTLIFLTSACGRLTLASPTPVWTVPPTGQLVLPTVTLEAPTATSIPGTPLIPVTGENFVSLQCEFCVDAETHAVLILADFAYFDVGSNPTVSCLTADVTGGKRMLICHGPQSTSFNLNICSAPSNCLHFPVHLQPCPLLQAGATSLATNTPFAPLFLTPVSTGKAPTKKSTPPAGTATGTPVPSVTSYP